MRKIIEFLAFLSVWIVGCYLVESLLVKWPNMSVSFVMMIGVFTYWAASFTADKITK